MGYLRQSRGRGSIHVACAPQGLKRKQGEKICHEILTRERCTKGKANYLLATAVSPQMNCEYSISILQ